MIIMVTMRGYTEKQRADRLRATRKYNQSKHGRAKRKEYRQTEAGKRSQQTWALSEKGRDSQAKYRKTEKRKAVLKKYQSTEKFKKTLRKYHQTDKGRANLARGVHKRRSSLQNCISNLTAEQWREIKDKYRHKCAYCRRRMERLTMDHVIPLSKGGHHIAENIVPACRSCNSKKGNRPQEELRSPEGGITNPALTAQSIAQEEPKLNIKPHQ
ncbi:hypothetical protein CMI37_36790 [Candidatus Pacearchaeota archaeon]|nr:hypothetical protein [Candidatus Pacearchaeota archaeon]